MLRAPIPMSAMLQTHWQGVLYGPPGGGKTCFAMASRLRTFMFDVDNGRNAAIAFRVRNGLPIDGMVDIWPIETVADFDAATAWLVPRIAQYGLVVIDTATELQRIITKERCERSKLLVPDQRAWGDIRAIMENLTVAFRHLPVNLVYVCHEICKADANNNGAVFRPSFDGRWGDEYAKHFSWIARYVTMYVAGADGKPTVQRALSFGPDPYQHFKDRSGMMGRYELPQYDQLLVRMMQSTQQQQPQQPAVLAAAPAAQPQITR